MKWKTEILANGEHAIAPEIISASRATDIPAFYSKWFLKRLQDGFLTWKNPFNGRKQYVSFSNTRLIVFWSKNPAPLLPYLPILDKKNVNYYFHFTLNNYEKENYEPNLPDLKQRLETFINLSDCIGKEKVIWRFDPIFTSSELSQDELLERISALGEQLHPYTNRLVFSFADIEKYKKVRNNLAKKSISYKTLTTEERMSFVEKLSKKCNPWNIDLRACAQEEDYSLYHVKPNKCIDDVLIAELFPKDDALMNYIYGRQKSAFPEPRKGLKDTGQRKHCQCIKSKDIGMYNSCPHLCAYCYANTSDKTVLAKTDNHIYQT